MPKTPLRRINSRSANQVPGAKRWNPYGICLTCKYRRIKCDGSRPSCSPCVLAKRRCEGYPAALTVSPLTESRIIANDAERRAFLFFRTRTASRILGHHDAHEWLSILLQYGYTHASVKCAIVALGSFHESLEPFISPTVLDRPSHRSNRVAYDLALCYYNRVIQYLRKTYYTYMPDPDTVMILCILLLCLEQFRRGDAACVTHLAAGLRKLCWWRDSTSNYNTLRHYSKPTSELINEKIAPMVQRLRVQFALCMDQRHTSGELHTVPNFPRPVTPVSYTNMLSARADFDRCMDYVLANMEQSQNGDQTLSSCTAPALLHNWKSALDSSQFRGDNVAESCALKLLHLYYNAALVITGTYNAKYETAFDEFYDLFNKMLILARDVLHSWTSVAHTHRMLFSFDLGLTPPMFLVASRCRDPVIRREAVSVLINSPDYRGAWHDHYSALCAQRIIEIEEDGRTEVQGCWEIPETSRIRKVSADFHEDEKHIEMQYIRSPYLRAAPLQTTTILLSPLET